MGAQAYPACLLLGPCPTQAGGDHARRHRPDCEEGVRLIGELHTIEAEIRAGAPNSVSLLARNDPDRP